MIGDESLHPVTKAAGFQSFRNLFLNMLLPATLPKDPILRETHPLLRKEVGRTVAGPAS